MQHYEEGSALTTEHDPRHEARGDGIEQLREILFGTVLHDLERRIALADSQHQSREHDLKYEARRRVEIIESHLRKELDALAARVEREVVETGEAIRGLTREQREASNAMEQRMAKLEETMSHAQKQLRQDVLDQAKSFLDELESLRLDFSSALENRLRRVESDLEIGAAPDEDEQP